MQLGHYLDFVIESAKVVEAKVMVTDQKVTFAEMLACEVEGRASEVKQEFQRAKRHADAMMDNIESFARKLKQVGEWLASMRK